MGGPPTRLKPNPAGRGKVKYFLSRNHETDHEFFRGLLDFVFS